MPFSSAARGSSVASAYGREAADREVRDEVEAEHPREERVETGRQLRPVRERDEDVAADRDDHDEQAERQLGAAALAGDRREGHGQRAGRCRRDASWLRGRAASALRSGRGGGSRRVVVVVVVEVAATSASSVATKLPGVESDPRAAPPVDPVVVELA